MNAPEHMVLRWPAATNAVPKAIFDDPALFERELENIFYGPEWHPVAVAGELPRRGDFKTLHVGRRPLLIVRGDDDRLRVFYNACAHRGTLLETRFCGNRQEFECPYHRWLFDAQGQLRGAPGREDFAPGFRTEDFGLTQLRSADFGGLLFVTMSPAAPSLEQFLGRIGPALRTALGGDGRLGLLGYQKVVYDTNWKAYVDNDGYHPPLLHKAFKMLNWQGGAGTQYATERGHVVIEAELKLPDNPGFLRDPSLLEFRQAHRSKGSVAVVISPLTVITMHLDMINIRFAIPRAVGKTEVHYGYFHHLDDDPDMIRHRLRQAGNMLGPSGLVSIEDAAIFHRIQAGNRTPGNAVFQKGVHDEHALWFDFKQNDEAGNMPRWEWYRKAMGFVRDEA